MIISVLRFRVVNWVVENLLYTTDPDNVFGPMVISVASPIVVLGHWFVNKPLLKQPMQREIPHTYTLYIKIVHKKCCYICIGMYILCNYIYDLWHNVKYIVSTWVHNVQYLDTFSIEESNLCELLLQKFELYCSIDFFFF